MEYGKSLKYDHEAVSVDGISHEALPRKVRIKRIGFAKIFRKAGVKRISHRVKDMTATILREFLKRVLKQSMTIMQMENRKTLCLIHALYALKLIT